MELDSFLSVSYSEHLNRLSLMSLGVPLAGRALRCDEDISAAIPHANAPGMTPIVWPSSSVAAREPHTSPNRDGRRRQIETGGHRRQRSSNNDGYAAEEFA